MRPGCNSDNKYQLFGFQSNHKDLKDLEEKRICRQRGMNSPSDSCFGRHSGAAKAIPKTFLGPLRFL